MEHYIVALLAESSVQAMDTQHSVKCGFLLLQQFVFNFSSTETSYSGGGVSAAPCGQCYKRK